MNYYHISPIKNKASIIKSGLRSNSNEIFVYTDLMQHFFIAAEQLMISEYAIFEISKKGITGNILNDNVAEFGSDCQYIIEQKLIDPKYITHITDVLSNIFDLINMTEKMKLTKMGYKKTLIIDLMRLYPDRVNRYNEVHGTNYKPMTHDEFNTNHSG